MQRLAVGAAGFADSQDSIDGALAGVVWVPWLVLRHSTACQKGAGGAVVGVSSISDISNNSEYPQLRLMPSFLQKPCALAVGRLVCWGI